MPRRYTAPSTAPPSEPSPPMTADVKTLKLSAGAVAGDAERLVEMREQRTADAGQHA